MPKKRKTQRKPRSKRSQSLEHRALLESKAARIWLRRLNGAVMFLRELSALPVSHKDTWAKGNWEHYKKQAHTLLEKPPKGAEKYAAQIRKELKNLEL